ncbi:MAG: Panacea domain-containing protein [Candidatus Coatesbacteria bacterium]
MILWIACRSRTRTVDLYTLVKTILFADLYHLNKYGRTIYGDVYLAMPHGPIPRHAYEIIKKEPLDIAELGTIPICKAGKSVKVTRAPKLDLLSKSDIEALSSAWERCRRRSFTELKLEADALPFYVKTWASRMSDNEEIDLADMLDPENRAKADELREVAPSISI